MLRREVERGSSEQLGTPLSSPQSVHPWAPAGAMQRVSMEPALTCAGKHAVS